MQPVRWVRLALVLGLVLVPVACGDAAPGPDGGNRLAGAVIYETNLEYYPNRAFADLEADLPRLAELGVSVLYLTPIWEDLLGDNHHYLIKDYYRIHPRFGGGEDLKSLVDAAHAQGIRVLLDLVTSLTAEGSVVWDEHRDWILRGDDGTMQRYYPFPDWGWAIDATNPEAIRYFAEVARHYVETYGIDGWRVDSPQNNYDPARVTGDHSRLELLRAVKRAVREANPDAVLVCELPGPGFFWGASDAGDPPLFDEVCEASYGYPFIGFLGGNAQEGYFYVVPDGSPANGRLVSSPLNDALYGAVDSATFVRRVQARRTEHGALRANFLENHDTPRAALAFPQRARALAVLLYTLPGVPVLHAGQELGAKTDPYAGDVRVDWSGGDRALEAFYRTLLTARRRHAALVRGGIRDVWKSGDAALAYLRHAPSDAALVAVNFSERPAAFEVALPLEPLGLEPDGVYTLRALLSGERRTLRGRELAALALALEPYAAEVYFVGPGD
ncbi:alpha amylase catalytic region [Oceanithermus profundus DSM 14977]|uniref:Alpha amylase catalytic region n=1 Tax=Oceanithermus profundus (strain DSM 14977 / NBRC 100410 / VKM B-2274 / 506) TaxID=670487 RepID=E4U591_OCEP5|nr:alpha-amylase family glycosyl hydrolase [Oceanithermus profundus]ADR37565.1 alpha amylase catalytic region [Oceanithermus profundus DSM 14977]